VIRSEDEAQAFVAERCDEEAMGRLRRLAAMLVEENAQQNLVSAASLDYVWQRHIADSAQLLEFFESQTEGPLIDLGSGAGFPGLVLAAMRPDLEIILVESRRLRVEWLSHCIANLRLDQCTVQGRRVELVPDLKAGIITARAFAPMPKLVKLAIRFSTDDTLWLLPKGRSAAQEVADLPANLRAMFHVEQSLVDPEAGIVVGRVAETGWK
jgi:16S rRNA (guanine527-N7)-methyltransferase